MKKILIVNNNLEIGGVATSLSNLLKEIQDKYDVTLLLFKDKKEYIGRVPNNIKVITINSAFKYFGVSNQEVKKKPLAFIMRSFWAILCKLFGRSFVAKCMRLTQKKISGYDIAISFLHEHPKNRFYGGCNEFVLQCVSAEEKIAWVHCDFRNNGANNKKTRQVYQKFDKIVACSESTRDAFIECFPELCDKTFVVRNCNDYLNIENLANPAICYGECFNILTVARLAKEKGVDRALYAVKYCIENGLPVKYHIVGDGKERQSLQKLVLELNLQNDVVFYGAQKNPYKYIKNADLMLLTSYHEAAPMIFDETACLGVPVLTTRTTSAYEMVESIECGIVCENEQDSISKTLFEICSNRDVLNQIKRVLKRKTFNNKLAIRQFDAVIQRGFCDEKD